MGCVVPAAGVFLPLAGAASSSSNLHLSRQSESAVPTLLNCDNRLTLSSVTLSNLNSHTKTDHIETTSHPISLGSSAANPASPLESQPHGIFV